MEEQLKKMKEEFISNISHELRTPLAIAKGSVELVLENTSDPEQSLLLNRSMDSLNKLGQLIDDLIAVAQLNGNTMLELEWVDVEEEISECLMEVYPVAAMRRIKVRTQLHSNLPSIVGDKNKIKKVFSCLMDNALKFSRDGGEIVIRSQLSNGSIGIVFEDRGIGIPEDEIKKIFKCFYQVDGSTNRHYNGMGIGLTIADKIMGLHGGRIRIRSKNGHGTVTTAEFPLNSNVFRKLKDKVYI